MPTLISLKQLNQLQLSGFITGVANTYYIPITSSGTFATDAELAASGAYIISLINSSASGVGAINGQSGLLNFYGSGDVVVFNSGQNFYIGYTGVGGNSGLDITTLDSYLSTGNYNLNNTVRQTGDQDISGLKNFLTRPTVNGTGVLLSGEAISINTGVLTGVFYPLYANPSDYISTGAADSRYYSITNPNNYASSGNLVSVSGVLSGQIQQTGEYLFNLITGVSGLSPQNVVFTTGDQEINGVKTFYDNIYALTLTCFENDSRNINLIDQTINGDFGTTLNWGTRVLSGEWTIGDINNFNSTNVYSNDLTLHGSRILLNGEVHDPAVQVYLNGDTTKLIEMGVRVEGLETRAFVGYEPGVVNALRIEGPNYTAVGNIIFSQIWDNLNNVLLDAPNKQLTGNWQTNTIPTVSGHIVNKGYLDSITGSFSNNTGNYIIQSSGIGNSLTMSGLYLPIGAIISGVNNATAPTVTLGGAGNVSGTVNYVVTFVTPLGETAQQYHSSTVSPSNQIVQLSNIPTGYYTVTGRRIYRLNTTTNTDQFYKLVGSINDNTTTTFNDNLATATSRLAGNVNTTALLYSYNLAIGTNTPQAPIHVVISGEGHGVNTSHLNNPHYVFIGEAEDPMIFLAGENEGSHGAGIELADFTGPIMNNKWGIIRRSNGAPQNANAIYFYYGTGQDSSQGALPYIMTPTGNFYAVSGFTCTLDQKLAWNADNYITTTSNTGSVWAGAGSVSIIVDSNNNGISGADKFSIYTDGLTIPVANEIFRIDSSGRVKLFAPIYNISGTSSLPSITENVQTDKGFWFGNNSVFVGTSGVERMKWTNSGVFTDTIPTQSGNVINKGYLDAQTGTLASQNYVNDSGRKYNHVVFSSYFDFIYTGTNFNEIWVNDPMIVTGLRIGAIQSGTFAGVLNSGASGIPLFGPLTGRFYQRGINNDKVSIAPFSFNSGVIYQETFLPNLQVSGLSRIGIDIYSGLSGIGGVSFGLFGYLS